MPNRKTNKRQYKYTEKQLNIMRTAFLTAFPKIFSDIPYSKDIFTHMLHYAIYFGFTFAPNLFVPNLAIELEARYKAVSSALKFQMNQYYAEPIVIELGTGMSPRRLEFITISDYYEVDYPPIIQIKEKIYQDLGFAPQKEKLISIDIEDSYQFERFFERVRDDAIQQHRPIIVISEGLFWYLSRSDIYSISKIIANSIKEISGVWISGDCSIDDKLLTVDSYREVIANSSECSMREPFESYEDFNYFFSSLGFSVTCSRLNQWVSANDLLSTQVFSSICESVEKRINDYTNLAIMYKSV